MIETSLYNFNTERAVNKVMPLLGHKNFWTVKESEDRPMHTSAAFMQKKKKNATYQEENYGTESDVSVISRNVQRLSM